MSKSVQVSYIWDEANFEKQFEASYDYLFNNSAKRYIGWLFIALLQFGVVAALKQNSFGLLLFSTIVLLYWYYGKKRLAKYRAKKAFLVSPIKDGTITLTLDKKTLQIQNALGKREIAHQDIHEAKLLENGVFFMLETQPYFIPKELFSSPKEMKRFVEMLHTEH